MEPRSERIPIYIYTCVCVCVHFLMHIILAGVCRQTWTLGSLKPDCIAFKSDSFMTAVPVKAHSLTAHRLRHVCRSQMSTRKPRGLQQPNSMYAQLTAEPDAYRRVVVGNAYPPDKCRSPYKRQLRLDNGLWAFARTGSVSSVCHN